MALFGGGNNTIKGIKVTIGGDTRELSTALKGVTADSKATAKELREVNKALKYDPTNTTLLSQKHKLLGRQISNTKERLDTLRRAQAEFSDELKGTEEGAKQYRALEREIAITEGTLREMLVLTARDLQQTGQKIEAIGKTYTTHISAPLAGAGAAAVKVAADFESAMSQVQATMGITRDSMTMIDGQSVNTMDALSGLAKQLGQDTAFSASQCAEALNYLALAGYDAEEMTKTLPTILNLAAAGGMELAQSSDMVTDAMSALGMDTADAEKMVDQMAKTSSTTNTSVAQLGEGILKIGATARQIKGGTAELSTALGILANNGIKGAEGGTHLRNVINSLQKSADAATGAIEGVNVAVYDSDGKMRSLNDILGDLNKSMDGMTDQQKADIIRNIFKETDLAAVNALLASTGDEWNALQQSIANSNGAAAQMAETQLDNLHGQLTLLKSALEGLGISIGEILLPTVKEGVETVQGWVDRFNALDDSQKNLIVRLGAVAAAIGPATIAGGKLTSAIGTGVEKYHDMEIAIGKIIGKYEAETLASGGTVTAMGKAQAVMAGLLNPAGLVVGALGLMALGFTAARDAALNSNEGFQTVKKTADEITDSMSDTSKKLQDSFSGYDDNISKIEAQKGVADRLTDSLEELANKSELTAAEQAGMKSAMDQLNAMYPGLNLYIDEATGKLSMGADEIRRYTENASNMALIDAYGKAASEGLQAVVEAEAALYEAEQKQKEVQAEVTELQNAANAAQDAGTQTAIGYKGAQDNITAGMIETANALTEAQARQAEADEAVKQANLTVDEANAKIQYYTDRQNELSSAIGMTTAATAENVAQQDAANAQTEATATGIYDVQTAYTSLMTTSSEETTAWIDNANALYTSLSDGISGAMTMFDEFSGGAEMSTEQMLANLQSQIDGVTAWEENINLLMDRGINTDMLQALIDAGPSSANAVATLANMSADEFARANELWAQKLDIKGFTNTAGTTLQNNMLSSISGATPEIVEAFNKSGSDSWAGFLRGMNAQKDATDKASREMADTAINGAKNELDEHSPSRVMQGIGDNAGAGFVLGITGKTGDVRNASIALAQAAVIDGNQLLHAGNVSGGYLGYGLADGIYASTPAAVAAARYMAESVIAETNYILDINSPSKVFRQIGQYSGEGYAEGLIDEIDGVTDAVQDVMQSVIDEAGKLSGDMSINTPSIAMPNFNNAGQTIDNRQTTQIGNIDISVTAQDGQTAQEIADEIETRLADRIYAEGAVWR